ncbi:hypothetical protein, partial [Nonomuraea fuscirosea]|uniref:hypothetical protein n=1 Tax=Nonomuraea fuscirosea TaxID=1291556 RepID=UPI001C6299FF
KGGKQCSHGGGPSGQADGRTIRCRADGRNISTILRKEITIRPHMVGVFRLFGAGGTASAKESPYARDDVG